MKRLFCFTILLYALVSKAQVSVPLRTAKISDVLATVDSAAQNAKNEYTLTKLDTAQGKLHGDMYFVLTDKNNAEKKLILRFLKSKEGRNADIGIAGTTYYYLLTVNGGFLDVFPFWKKFVQPDANMDKVIKEEGSYLLLMEGDKQRRVNLQKEGPDKWYIQII